MPYEAKSYNTNLLSEENIKKYVLPYYNLENYQVTQIKFKDTEKQRAVYKVTNVENSYCLKKIYFSIEELLFVYSAVEWLYRNDIKVPRILPTKNKSRFVNFENMLFILTPWVEGEKCSYDNLENVLQASINLAKIHSCTKNFKPISGSNYRTGFENLYSSLNKHFQQLLTCSNLAFKHGDKFSKIFLQHFDSNLILAQKAANIASTINNTNLFINLCHLDYVNKNILFDNSGNIWTIDFDKCKIDYRVHDLSYFLRRLLKRDNTKWDLELAINCLKLYEDIYPLNLDEYKAILVYLAFPQKFWKISRDYYNNINKCNKNSFITLLNKSCSKSDYHLQFIDGFTKHIENKFHTYII
ncbi:CotS family spore coat protein [Clostridium sp. SYSU_GA19001]|uniref:CotS family spore coat protein n=1 Tax=Clostridium caldaquaticum TaxID=2940653 RepID=UPI002076E437|nr:CotS family spore coat protein [Clostridium caldaquaticum]MCM8710425.1 CotS family spore coat protein [Clostridium caldaquaticum]